MSEIARISAVVTANTSQFTKSMTAADASIKSTTAQMGRMDAAAATATGGMQRLGKSSSMAAIGIKAAKVGLAALAVTAFVGFKEMKQQEKVSAMTANTLRNVGNSAGFTVKKIEAMSKSIALQTGTSHTLIQSSSNILLGFKDIGNNSDIFSKVLSGAMDRAAKTGRDLVATTRAIGFAYQSPISGVGMLRRAGILLDKDTQKHIVTLQKEGHLEQARALLLDKVTGSAKGAAKALGQTSTGQVNRLNEAFKQMSENVAQAVLPGLLAIGPPLISLMKSLTPLFQAVGNALKTVVDAVAPLIQAILGNAAAVKALTVAAIAFIGLGLASKVLAIGTAFRASAAASLLFGRSAAAAAGGQAVGGVVGLLSTVGKIGGAYAGAALGVGKFAQTATVFDKHVASTGRLANASKYAKSEMSALGAALPLVANPLGLVTAAVGVGIAALFLFADKTSAETRQMNGLRDAAQQTAVALNQTNTAISNEITALTSLSGMNASVVQKQAAAKAAQQAYNQAVMEGARAGETAAQYQSRLNGLRDKALSTANAARNAESQTTSQIKNTVSNLDTLTGAYGRQKQAIQSQIEKDKAAGTSFATSSKVKKQAALDMLASEGQLATLEKQRPAQLRSILDATKSAAAAVKGSAMSDSEKTAALAKINDTAAKTRSELNKLSSTKGKIKVEGPEKTSEERLKEIRRQFGLLPSGTKVLNVMTNYTTKGTKPPGGFRGGFVAGYASGGKVRGPAGRDVIPAMLTAGEVVLTKQQQRMVDSGMNIREAIMKTGGAYAAGGAVGKKKKKDPKQAKADAKSRFVTAGGRAATVLQTNIGRQISEKYQGGRTGIGSIEQTRRAQEANIKTMTSNFKGNLSAVQMPSGAGSFAGGFKDFDNMQRKSDREWERTWTGTIKLLDGSTFSGGFKDFNKKAEAGRKALNAQYDALTASEAALKAMDQAQSQADLSSNLNDAMAALQQAQQWGDPKEVAAAQKAVAAAQADQQRAALTASAAQERSAAEAARTDALAAYDEQKAAELQLLQDSFDDAKALRDTEWQAARDALQTQLDDQLQAQRDADNMRLADLQWAQDQEQIKLDQRIAALNAHFESANGLTTAQMNKMAKKLSNYASVFELSGSTLIDALATGLKAGGPGLKQAVAKVAGLIQDYLKLNSPAKKGPLSEIDHWFDALAPTLASGMDMTAVERGLNGLATPTAGTVAGGGGATVEINLTVNDSTFAGMSREQVDRVAREVQAAINRRVSFSI